MAMVALEVSCLLVLDEDGIGVKVAVTIPAPGFYAQALDLLGTALLLAL